MPRQETESLEDVMASGSETPGWSRTPDYLRRYPEYPPWNRLRLSRDWMPGGSRRVLDAGCSWGYGTRFYMGQGVDVVGVEADPEYVAIARDRYPAAEFRQEPLERLSDADESFDYLVCADVLEHVTDPIRALDQLFRVLRPGGSLFLSTPHRGAFEFLDPYNYGRRFRQHLPRLYARLVPGNRWRPGMPIGDEHRHYTQGDLVRLLRTSAFGEAFTMERCFKSGLFLYPLELNVGIMVDRGLPRLVRSTVKAPFQAFAELDYWIPYGDLSFNIAMLIRKGHSSG